MTTPITVLLGFLISVQVAVFLAAAQGISGLLERLPFQEAASAPMIVIVFGCPIQLAVLWMILRELREVPADERFFPQIFAIHPDRSSAAYWWEKVSAILALGVPIIGFIWCWDWVLREAEFWVADGSAVPRQISMWASEPSCPLNIWFQSGPCRHGRLDQLSEDITGVDFLPLQQSLLMLALSAAVLLFTALTLFRLRGRGAARLDTVRKTDRSKSRRGRRT